MAEYVGNNKWAGWDRDEAQLVDHQVWCAADAGLTPQFGKGFTPESTFIAHFLTVLVHTPYVQLHALT